MSQYDFGTINPNEKSGSQLALDLNGFRDAVNSGHKGAERPTYAQAGMQWIREVSTERWDLMLYDGESDTVLRSINPETNELIKLSTSDIAGLDDTLAQAVRKDSAATTGAALLPAGSAAQRPAAPVVGMQRHNTDLGDMERYQGGKWLPLNVMDKALNEAPAVTLASAATVAIGAAAANTIKVSGTTTITGFDVIADGATRRLVFQGALTLTHNGASLILPGTANIRTAAGDIAEFLSLGSGNWKCISYTRADGSTLATDFTIIYPNGGTSGSPANVAINSRYTEANPFPGFHVQCQAQVLYAGEWTDIGLSGYASGQSAGVSASQRDSGVVMVETGTNFLGTVATYMPWAAASRANISTQLPCRIKVRKGVAL